MSQPGTQSQVTPSGSRTQTTLLGPKTQTPPTRPWSQVTPSRQLTQTTLSESITQTLPSTSRTQVPPKGLRTRVTPVRRWFRPELGLRRPRPVFDPVRTVDRYPYPDLGPRCPHLDLGPRRPRPDLVGPNVHIGTSELIVPGSTKITDYTTRTWDPSNLGLPDP